MRHLPSFAMSFSTPSFLFRSRPFPHFFPCFSQRNQSVQFAGLCKFFFKWTSFSSQVHVATRTSVQVQVLLRWYDLSSSSDQFICIYATLALSNRLYIHPSFLPTNPPAAIAASHEYLHNYWVWENLKTTLIKRSGGREGRTYYRSYRAWLNAGMNWTFVSSMNLSSDHYAVLERWSKFSSSSKKWHELRELSSFELSSLQPCNYSTLTRMQVISACITDNVRFMVFCSIQNRLFPIRVFCGTLAAPATASCAAGCAAAAPSWTPRPPRGSICDWHVD